MSVEETKNCLVMSAAPCCCSILVEKKDKSDVCGLVVIYLSRNYITSFKLYCLVHNSVHRFFYNSIFGPSNLHNLFQRKKLM